MIEYRKNDSISLDDCFSICSGESWLEALRRCVRTRFPNEDLEAVEREFHARVAGGDDEVLAAGNLFFDLLEIDEAVRQS